MRRSIPGSLFLVGIFLLAPGCTRDDHKPLLDKFKQVQLQMPLAEAVKLLGQPQEMAAEPFRATLQGNPPVAFPPQTKFFRWGQTPPTLLVAVVDDRIAMTNLVLVERK